jgi:hypothetical protein
MAAFNASLETEYSKLLRSDLAEMHGLQLETRVIREIGL